MRDDELEAARGVVYACLSSLVLWALFAFALVASQGSLDAIWEWLQSQHIVIQVLVLIFFLPVTAGLWVWQTGWPLILRLILDAGLAIVTLVVFFPRFLLGGRP